MPNAVTPVPRVGSETTDTSDRRDGALESSSIASPPIDAGRRLNAGRDEASAALLLNAGRDEGSGTAGADDDLAPLGANRTPAASIGGFRRRDSAPAAPSTRSPRAPLAGRPTSGALHANGVPETPGLPGFARPLAGAHLSPRMTAIFGGLFGLATVTSIIALLIQVVPVRDERALVAASLTGSAPPPQAPADAPTVKKKERTVIAGPWRVAELAKDPSALIVSDAMERRSFIAALADKGVPKAQVYRVMKAFEGTRKFDKSGRKDRFTVAMDRTTRRVRAFEYQVSATEVYQAREDANGLLTGSTLDMKIAEEEVIAAFYVGKDVLTSYKSSGLEDGILDVIDEALSGRMSTESFEEGGTVRLIAMEETALGLFSRYKKVIAIEYRPADPAAKPVRIYDFTGKESRGYFDERGRQPYAGGWRAPVPGAPVTSRFNPKRMHPVLHKPMPHNGTDLGAPMGTPAYAAYRGVVESVGPAGPSGNLVTITHPNGVTTGYAHLSRFAPGIKVGDRIGTHQLVGYVGSTGRSTGPHLHFSAKRDGKFFDPETLQLDGERVMPGVDRAAFSAAKEALDKRLDAIPLPEPPPEPPPPAAKEAPSAAPSDPVAAGSAAIPPDPTLDDPDDPGNAPDPAPQGGDDEEGESIQGADLKNPPPPSSAP